jgi:hypothetical protein
MSFGQMIFAQKWSNPWGVPNLFAQKHLTDMHLVGTAMTTIIGVAL